MGTVEVAFALLPGLSEEVMWLARFRNHYLGKDLSVP